MTKFKVNEEITYFETTLRYFIKAKVKLIVMEKDKINYVIEYLDKIINVEEKMTLPFKTDEEILSLNKKLIQLEKERLNKLQILNKEIEEKFQKIIN